MYIDLKEIFGALLTTAIGALIFIGIAKLDNVNFKRK